MARREGTVIAHARVHESDRWRDCRSVCFVIGTPSIPM